MAKNLLQRDFQPRQPNQVWAANLTYIPTKEGWLYLAVVLDLYSRLIVGWSMSDRMPAELPVAALQMAVQWCSPPPGLIHHSDRGSGQAWMASILPKTAGRRRLLGLNGAHEDARLLGQNSALLGQNSAHEDA